MIANGYADARTLERRIEAHGSLARRTRSCSQPDADAEYAAVIEIDLADINEPIVACPNDPDDVKTLSEVAGAKIDEVFIGSCMTNIGHFRAAAKLLEGKRDIPVKLWVAPPTKMDASELTEEGHYGVLGNAGRAHGDAGLLAVHGQPGAGARRRDGDVHLAPATSPTAWARTPTSTSARPSWRRSARALGRIPTVAEYMARHGRRQPEGGRHLPLHELRPDPRLPRIADTVVA